MRRDAAVRRPYGACTFTADVWQTVDDDVQSIAQAIKVFMDPRWRRAIPRL